MKIKLLSILALATVAPAAYSAIAYTNTFNSSTGLGVVFADGAQIATFTVTDTVTVNNNTGTVGLNISGVHDAGESVQVDMTITDSDFTLTSMRWSSRAGVPHLAVGNAEAEISLNAAGTVTADIATWTLDGAAFSGTAAYTAGAVLSTGYNDDTPEDAWVISSSALNQTLSYGSSNANTLSAEVYEVEFFFVPEPSSAALLGLGGLALLARRKR